MDKSKNLEMSMLLLHMRPFLSVKTHFLCFKGELNNFTIMSDIQIKNVSEIRTSEITESS